jgi:ABC-2 type transport system permease protein
MQVYKAYFKIIKKNLIPISVYFVVFVGVSLLISASVMGQTDSAFNPTKSKIAIFNGDSGAPLTQGLVDYLGANTRVVNIDDDTQSIQDALFYGNADYILRIPSGFAQGFMSGEAPRLEKTTAASTPAGVSLDIMVEKYLNIANFYLDNLPGVSQRESAANVANDLLSSAYV